VVTETEQRFILRYRERNLARFIGYPVGGFLVLVAISGIPSVFSTGEYWGLWSWIAGMGVSLLVWAWIVGRIRVEVTEQKITVVNPFTRYEVPWSALYGIELAVTAADQSGNQARHRYCLAFVTPSKEVIRAWVPQGRLRVMTKVHARILRARGQSLANEPRSDAITVTGLAPVLHRLDAPVDRFGAAVAKRLGPSKSQWLRNALVIAAIVGSQVSLIILL
jgi:Bacterial PH domain